MRIRERGRLASSSSSCSVFSCLSFLLLFILFSSFFFFLVFSPYFSSYFFLPSFLTFPLLFLNSWRAVAASLACFSWTTGAHWPRTTQTHQVRWTRNCRASQRNKSGQYSLRAKRWWTTVPVFFACLLRESLRVSYFTVSFYLERSKRYTL